MIEISTLDLIVVKEKTSLYDVNEQITCMSDSVKIFNDALNLSQKAEEVIAMLTLDIRNRVTGIFIVSKGTICSSVAHPREVLKRALLQNAKSIILAHNHPSGDVTPSTDDIEFTKRMKEASDLLMIDFLDHIIVTENRNLSLKKYM